MLAAIWDTPYNIVYLVHILSVIVAVSVTYLAPVVGVRARRGIGKPLQDLIDELAATVIFPGFLLAGITGGAMVGLSDDVYDFGQTWLSVGGAVWIAVLALALVVYPPSYARLVNVGEDRKRMLGGLLHLAVAVMLVLMVWKFGT